MSMNIHKVFLNQNNSGKQVHGGTYISVEREKDILCKKYGMLVEIPQQSASYSDSVGVYTKQYYMEN